MIWLVIILGVLADRVTKMLITAKLPLGAAIPVIGDNIFALKHVHNEGAAWSILSGRVGFLLIVTVIVTIIIAYMLYKTPKEKKLLRFSFALLISGALGNIIDRLLYGYVIDFLSFGSFPVFNVADCCVTVGIGLIIVLTLWDIKKENAAKGAAANKKQKDNEKQV